MRAPLVLVLALLGTIIPSSASKAKNEETTTTWRGKGAATANARNRGPSKADAAARLKRKSLQNYGEEHARRLSASLGKGGKDEKTIKAAAATQTSARARKSREEQKTSIPIHMRHLQATERAAALVEESRSKTGRYGGHSTAELMFAKGKCSWKLCSGVSISQAALDFLRGAFLQKTLDDVLIEYLDWSLTEVQAVKRGEWPMDRKAKKCASIQCPDKYTIESIKDLGDNALAIARFLPEVNMRRIQEHMRDPFEDSVEIPKTPEQSELKKRLDERVQKGFRDKADLAGFKSNPQPLSGHQNAPVSVEMTAAPANGDDPASRLLYHV